MTASLPFSQDFIWDSPHRNQPSPRTPGMHQYHYWGGGTRNITNMVKLQSLPTKRPNQQNNPIPLSYNILLPQYHLGNNINQNDNGNPNTTNQAITTAKHTTNALLTWLWEFSNLYFHPFPNNQSTYILPYLHTLLLSIHYLILKVYLIVYQIWLRKLYHHYHPHLLRNFKHHGISHT